MTWRLLVTHRLAPVSMYVGLCVCVPYNHSGGARGNKLRRQRCRCRQWRSMTVPFRFQGSAHAHRNIDQSLSNCWFYLVFGWLLGSETRIDQYKSIWRWILLNIQLICFYRSRGTVVLMSTKGDANIPASNWNCKYLSIPIHNNFSFYLKEHNLIRGYIICSMVFSF